ncbi:Glycosyl transferase, family 2 domain protein [Rhodopirellula maiorica SM1]|uniref:Glycosyl transferase, family 2 domain protein n=1 Tax=Rhodopirellula maiorica SM1 TaxID=1265738 RepID=M5RJW9_9BACT|nr:glycosyltransferase [Rhodopirellula maiorica]EMI19486.1 Glycosyl transferase, family 2 domain protein [Rhodopirellula maiorica SM1]
MNQGCALPTVDVLMLCRPHSEPQPVVVDAIHRQNDVNVRLHIATGWPHSADRNRWQTIARARNRIKQRAAADWVMFVDDDVLLDPQCIATLVHRLKCSPTLGAVAADYDLENQTSTNAGHVGMGACLFRGEVLETIQFRSTANQCECACCCEDLRQQGIGITYCGIAKATHLGKTPHDATVVGRQARNHAPLTHSSYVLAAFDRRDLQRFEHQFLRSLRTWGNACPVIAVTYGLYPSEIRRLTQLSNVHVVARPSNGTMVPVRRLHEFAEITGRLPAEAAVAYWDVSDVVFQTQLDTLWQSVAIRPDVVHAVIEPKGYPDNAVIPAWSLSIHDPGHRRNAFELLKRNPFLNSGFAAGTAATLHRYFSAADRMRTGPELAGTTDWGDQMGLNLYCHQQPHRWHAADEGWNYCVHDRSVGEVAVSPEGLVISRRTGKIPVVHGNARSLRQFAISVHH